MADPIPAATLILFRDGPQAPEVLMVERARAMAFAGGAWVFPGGRIDPGDEALAALRPGLEDARARIAAIRETVEEAGVPVGIEPLPDQATTDGVRAGLHAGRPFGELLAEAGLTLAPERLVPFARWLPDHPGLRIFDARFYLAELPAGAPPARVDRTENTRLAWTTAQAMLDRADASLIYPTRRTLERLAQYRSHAEAVADARAHPIRTITPWKEIRDGVEHLCIPGDLGFPVTAEPVARVRRA
jgi:8-oxo-dGTP pyrophosphatase MutT (NUDIX family)